MKQTFKLLIFKLAKLKYLFRSRVLLIWVKSSREEIRYFQFNDKVTLGTDFILSKSLKIR